MKSFDKAKATFYHSLFWCLILFYDVIAWGSLENNYEKNFYIHLFILPPKILSSYLIAYLVVPRFLFRKKYALFICVTVLCLIVGGLFQNVITSFVVYPLYRPGAMAMNPLFDPTFILIQISGLLPSIGLLSAYVIIQNSFKHERASQQMEKEKLAAELNFLKSQVHPHFLFNTLNNLYALTLRNALETSEVVLRLSELLNYMLYESAVAFVPLAKELQSIRNYLSLEQLRYGKRLEVIFNVKGDVENIQIAPLLLIPLVENCFKHGAVKEIAGGWIEIDVAVKDDVITLKIENSKVEDAQENYNRSGIGLKNVSRRLDLIYPGNYEMKIFDESDRFMVVVKLIGGLLR